MSGTDKKTDEKKFNETLKRLLKTPPKPHKDKGDETKPDVRKQNTSRDKK